jgi:hypothetical protein
MGALVFLPIGHSPDVDLVAYANDRLFRIQVKTSTQEVATPQGKRAGSGLSRDQRWKSELEWK